MLDITDLRKVYEDGTVGVDRLDLKIAPGEIFVLLGANGAGKTSTIMLILGFTEPTAGRVLIAGIDVQKNP
ncbi:MAG: ATP-binding cassette domain-containing protein, partial [Kiritimatiellae bacterium]|nr:ATP-binding cassette domain-containing protein [Kiritimatiellia bacterium]